MASPAILKIDIIADATKAALGLDKTSKAAQTTGSKLSAVAKGAATGFAVGAIVKFGEASVGAARDSQVATARLEQVFRSMGDTTGTAAKAAEDYAGSLSRKIGVDDEAIMSSQALLATFAKASDETARQAGIFDRATAAAADLAAAGYGDLNTNAKQLGKALNDPVKGTAALTKAGVQFTDAQKKQIDAMVKAGDVTGAQKIILGEVEHQVKGTAGATATSADKMNVAFGETQEAVGNALVPVLEKLLPMLTTLADFISKNISWILPLAAVIAVLAVAWNIASVAATLFGTSMLAALWPVLLVIAAIAALIAIGVLIVKNWDTIKAAAAAVWAFMVAAWNAILGAIKAAWNWIKANWPLLLAILTGPIGIAVLLITRNWDSIKAALAKVFDWIKSVWGTITSFLTRPFTAAWEAISGIVSKISGAISGALEGAKRIAGNIADALKGPINAVIRAWNGLEFKVPEVSVGPIHFGGQTIGLPNIPELARGGLVSRSGLAVVHAGERWSGVGGGGWGSTTINVAVTTTGLGADAPQIQRAVVEALRGYVGRNGPLDVPVRSVG